MARLTDQEQQEIIRFIEADKPLPDKYRFLLFQDKREVELVWNGKTEEDPLQGVIQASAGASSTRQGKTLRVTQHCGQPASASYLERPPVVVLSKLASSSQRGNANKRRTRR